ncbi:Uncharacterised protein [Amycolatopsis camponoti]|uniref:Uncharacterized protein n=1 Tax=Amycolatopsis camponoti TaxID=2606593 RepID=A0A6I8LTK5_9PSEU|nr:Uncharacterised protein [Amycolatopsis camponoti]
MRRRCCGPATLPPNPADTAVSLSSERQLVRGVRLSTHLVFFRLA